MSEYVVHGRGHDAEWLLQNERTLNDRILQAGRAGKKLMSRSPVSSRPIGSVREIDPWEAEMGARWVGRMAAVRGVDDVADVLDMLGLAGS